LDLKEIKELIALMRRNDLSEFKLEQENFKITLRRGVDFPAYAPAAPQPQYQLALPQPAAAASAPAAGAAAAESSAPREKLREITSPMVGTFYAAPSPDSPPFVTAGQEVTEDTVVCVIEAMKVMNEIKAEMDGTIVEVVAENGKPVQFGQVLFRVR
jgi:acetyl-CoA carboxylase biotin carboxyl carrier protein